MIRVAHGSFNPRFPQWRYKGTDLIFRSSDVGLWYCYLKWQVGNFGLIVSVDYVFPEEEIFFSYGSAKLKFMPDFKVKYIYDYLPEYQSTMTMEGSRALRIRSLLHQHPYLRLRFIEHVEVREMYNRLKLFGLDFKENLIYEGYPER